MRQISKYALRAFMLAGLMVSAPPVSAADTVSTTNTVSTTDAVPAANAVSTANAISTTGATPGPAADSAPSAGVNAPITSPASIQDIRPYIFSDVPNDFWAANSISAVTRAKLMKGYSDGTFKPDQPMTREEVATLFNNITDDGQSAFLSSKFKDITSDRWSALAIESVARKNIISGYGDDTYKPEQYMSRQEFAVVADNYIHYLGYTTEDPTVLDNIAYGDQKFVASWAQDAVRELAYLGFTGYAPGTLFNPEKYITRAEAAEIAYRMTQTPQALAFHNALYRQQLENKTAALINKALDYGDDFTKFRQDGALFWNDGQLHATVVNKKNYEKVASAVTEAHDPQLDRTLVVNQGKLTQAQLEDYQSDAINLYKEQEPQGRIIGIAPNNDASALVITADSVQKDTTKAFKKKFGKKVIVQLPPDETTGESATIHFPLPPRPTK